MELLDFKEEENVIWNVEYNSKQNTLYTTSQSAYIKTYTIQNNKLIETKPILTPHTRTIRKVKCNKHGMLGCTSFDGTISLIETNQNTILATLEGHESEVKGIDWNSTGSMFVSCSRDKAIWIWKSYMGLDFECCSVLTGHTGDVKCVLFHPNGNILYSGSFDGTIRIWKGEEETEWNEVKSISCDDKTIWDIKNTHDGKFVVATGANGLILLYESVDEDLVERDRIVDEKLRDVYSVDIIDNLVVVGCGDNGIRIYRLNVNMKKLFLFQENKNAHENDVNCVKWLNKTSFVSVGDDNIIKLWKLQI